MRDRARTSLAWLAVLALTVAACAQASPASQSVASPSAAASVDPAWAKTIEDAKAEGQIVVWGPTGPEIQSALTDGFKKAYGIDVLWTTNTGNEAFAKIQAEYAAGKYTVDFVMDGATTMSGFIDEGLLQPIEPLLQPDVKDPTKWRGGTLRYTNDDPEKRVLVTALFIPPPIVVNTDLVKADEINSTWQNLLDPKWKGKIASFDPRIPSHSLQVSVQLLHLFGEDFYKKLYVDQAVVLSGEDRQVSEWVARGQYPMALGIKPEFIEPFRDQGLPLEVVKIKDFAGYPSGGAVQFGVLAKSPHPNAAKVFANWMASKEGQSIIMPAFSYASGRLDVSTEGLPDYVIPVEGETYGLPDWGKEFRSIVRDGFATVQEIIGE